MMGKKKSVHKFMGILLVATGLGIFIFGLLVITDYVTESMKNPQPGQTGLEAILVFVFTFIISGIPFVIGMILLTDKKETILKNPNNPLICQYCKRDYDKTWKICLNCGKPLIDRASAPKRNE